MLLFYIRHGDPTYKPDTLTPLGKKQAEALAKRLCLYGIDKIFASTSTRAMMTAQPTCDLLKKEPTLLDFCRENHAWKEFTVKVEAGRSEWLFTNLRTRGLFVDPTVRELGHRWYEHPAFQEHDYKKGVERIRTESDKWLLTLGYQHEQETGRYKIIRSNDERIALFSHAGFGLAFLSCLLDIPYPQFCIHFDMCHTGMTVIEFKERDGYAIPRILTYSSDSHLYREGLPTNYNNRLRF